MSVAGDQASGSVNSSAERRAAGVACGAHALHDGFTDVIFVLLPLWQREFGLGYAEVGMLRGLYAGAMAAFQIPAALLALLLQWLIDLIEWAVTPRGLQRRAEA